MTCIGNAFFGLVQKRFLGVGGELFLGLIGEIFASEVELHVSRVIQMSQGNTEDKRTRERTQGQT